MPQLGESVVEGTIGKWLKSKGERVEKYEPLLEVVTDKVDTEITAPDSGLVLQLYAEEGETLQAGRLLAVIGEEGDAIPEPGSREAMTIVAAHSPEARAVPQPAAAKERPAKPEAGRELAGMRISPVVARIASEHDVDLSQVTGTGRGGRISKKDILNYIQVRDATMPRDQEPGEFFHPPEGTPAAPSQPAPTPETKSESTPGELVPLTAIRKTIADHMVRSVHTSPHVSTVFEVDCSRIVAHRAAHQSDYTRKGARLTYTAYFVLAAVRGLKTVPIVNSTFTEAGIQLLREINVGVAVALDAGLIVPVIKDADEKSLLGIAREVNDLAKRAREKELKPDEVQGGTFTITNHGVSGSLVATPIIHQPQAAILGVGTIQKRVVVLENDAIAIRPMAYLSLTFDHRIMDGAVADRFMMVLKQTLEDWQ
jgi:2-oxoglutarate dehydrogenase E2 component (dihydrolipoamide succinyltransferase)